MILLRMVCSSLTLISMSCGRREDGTRPGEKLPLDAPEAPLHRAPTYLPCQLSEERLEALVDILFREHLLMEKGGRSGSPQPGRYMGSSWRQGWDHSLATCHFTSPSLTLLICKVGI